MKAGRIAWSSTLGPVAWVLIGVGAAPAQVQYESAKLTASDAARGDQFGGSVAISNDVAVIGARRDDDAGSDAGSAYVFRRDGANWVQEQKLLASDGSEGDGFGLAVAVDGATVMVTAFQADTERANDGAVYVYEWDGVRWVERQKLLASDPVSGAQFGMSVAVDGDVAAIGEVGDQFAGGSEAGALYVFRRTATGWVQEQKLRPADLGAFDHLGSSVSVNGNVIVGGAPLQDPGGVAYVFRKGTRWVQEQKLSASDAGSVARFGISVGLDRNDIVVGADDGGGAPGAAYAYRLKGTEWIQIQKLTPPNVGGAFFGGGVSVRLNRALIGGQYGTARPGSGTAYVYERRDQTWVLIRTLIPSDGAASGGFGLACSLGEKYAVVGALGNDDACPEDPSCESGSAYVFVVPDCNANGIPDKDDIASGTSNDCNDNGVPDECDLAACSDDPACADCNANLIPDGCEPDCDLDGIPDDCEGPCPPLTGACCDRDPFGGCIDGLTLAECACERCEWTQDGVCTDVECPRDTIPTVGMWGFVILSLGLLIVAKIRFGGAVHGIRCNGTTLADQS